jgi:hypothetical protein
MLYEQSPEYKTFQSHQLIKNDTSLNASEEGSVIIFLARLRDFFAMAELC